MAQRSFGAAKPRSLSIRYCGGCRGLYFVRGPDHPNLLSPVTCYLPPLPLYLSDSSEQRIQADFAAVSHFETQYVLIGPRCVGRASVHPRRRIKPHLRCYDETRGESRFDRRSSVENAELAGGSSPIVRRFSSHRLLHNAACKNPGFRLYCWCSRWLRMPKVGRVKTWQSLFCGT